MATREINDITAKTTPAGSDEYELQETGGGLSKKVTFANMASNLPAVTAAGVKLSSGFLDIGPAIESTISAGVITITGSNVIVDTEADAATDDLDTITGGTEGQLLFLRSADSTRDPTVKDGTGNINLAGDFTFTTVDDRLLLRSRGGTWLEESRSNNS